VKNCNSSRLPWEETTAPKGAAAHSLGTTALTFMLERTTNINGWEFYYWTRTTWVE